MSEGHHRRDSPAGAAMTYPVRRRPGDPLLLADDYFLVALDERTGHLRVHRRTTALALAGARLAELVLAEHIAVVDGRIWTTSTQPPPDALAHTTLDQLAAEPEHGLAVWLAFLARDAVEAVAGRLVRSHILTRHVTRTLRLSTTVSYPPLDYVTAAWRAHGLANRITGTDPLCWQDVMHAALVSVTGLTAHVLSPARPRARPDDAHRLEQALAQLPGFPALHEIATQVEALIGNAVLTHRK